MKIIKNLVPVAPSTATFLFLTALSACTNLDGKVAGDSSLTIEVDASNCPDTIDVCKNLDQLTVSLEGRMANQETGEPEYFEKTTTMSGSSVVFENLLHDQRLDVTYDVQCVRLETLEGGDAPKDFMVMAGHENMIKLKAFPNLGCEPEATGTTGGETDSGTGETDTDTDTEGDTDTDSTTRGDTDTDTDDSDTDTDTDGDTDTDTDTGETDTDTDTEGDTEGMGDTLCHRPTDSDTEGNNFEVFGIDRPTVDIANQVGISDGDQCLELLPEELTTLILAVDNKLFTVNGTEITVDPGSFAGVTVAELTVTADGFEGELTLNLQACNCVVGG